MGNKENKPKKKFLNEDFKKTMLALATAGSLIGGTVITHRYSQSEQVKFHFIKKLPIEKKLTAIEQQDNLETDEDAYNNPLIVKRRAAIKAKAQEVFAKLNISNVHNKTPEEQRQIAFKLLTYLNQNSKSIFDDNTILNQNSKSIFDDNTIVIDKEDINSKNQYRERISKIYYLLCQGYNTDTLTANTYTLNLLCRMCGIDCNEVTTQLYLYGKPSYERKFLQMNFADGKIIWDPAAINVLVKSELINKVDESVYFMTEDNFREKYNDYAVISIDEPISLKGFIEPDNQLMQLR